MTDSGGHPVDAQGALINIADASTVHLAYVPALETAREALARREPSGDSFMVHGSVASGAATPGVSDLDLVLVTRSLPEPRELRAVASDAERRAPRGTEIDLTAVRPDQLLDLTYGPAELIVNLATSSVVLFGSAITHAPCIPGRRLATAMYPYPTRVVMEIGSLITSDLPFPSCGGKQRDRRFWLTWLARGLIRCSGASVMALDHRYARELRACVRLVSDFDPDFALLLSEGLGWGVQAPDEPEPIMEWATACLAPLTRLWSASA